MSTEQSSRAAATLARARTIYGQRGARTLVSKVVNRGMWQIYAPFTNLHAVGQRCGTDKADKHHTFKGLSYLDVYERYFSPMRRKPINILEMGVFGGCSLNTWKLYFPHARIFGLDIDPQCKQYEQDRIAITIGSQTDAQVLASLCQQAGHFDIIIDDASHVNQHILTSFKHLFPRLRSGGLYIIEDLGLSYQKLEEDGVREKWPGMKYNDPAENLNNVREDLDRFFSSAIADLDHLRGEILTIHFWSYVCVITKA